MSDIDIRWCLNCNSTEFMVENIMFLPQINDKVLPVMAYAYVCQRCYTTQMDTDQMDAFEKRANDRYARLVQHVRNDDNKHH